MKAAGMLFLARAKPSWLPSANGERVLMLRAVDRLDCRSAEPWSIFWSGPEADAFMAERGDMLNAGRAIWVELERIRPHRCGSFTELHGRVISLDLVNAEVAP
jgi:hypothetical protein